MKIATIGITECSVIVIGLLLLAIYWGYGLIHLIMNIRIVGRESRVWLLMMFLLPLITPAVYFKLHANDSLPIFKK